MQAGARPALSRLRSRSVRRAFSTVCLCMAGMAASAEAIVAARYAAPTERYPHAVLGDAIEHGALLLEMASGETRRFDLPERLVFEDTAPRLADLDGDGRPEVIVVESDREQGARLAIYGPGGRIAATPHIGTRFRWLAPLGAADLDGDGLVEIAYVDRPHLAKILRIWRFDRGTLREAGRFEGVTNHRIGETDIAGGIRHCSAFPEMILADAGWTSLLALRFDGEGVTAQRVGDDTRRAAFARALSCH